MSAVDVGQVVYSECLLKTTACSNDNTIRVTQNSDVAARQTNNELTRYAADSADPFHTDFILHFSHKILIIATSNTFSSKY